jgi:ABC-2 type transport system permease protein
MPIFDQGYQHWHGHLHGHAWRWLAITREGVRTQFRKRGLKWFVTAAFSPVAVLTTFLILWGLLEQKSSLLQPFLFLFQNLPDEIRQGPEAFRVPIWTLAFNYYFWVQTSLSMILVAIVGPDLISQDLRFNAIPLYFSRPLRRVDYFFGKFAIIGFFLAIATVLPALAAFLAGLAFSFSLGAVRESAPLLLGILAYGLIVMVSAGTLILAISSLSRSSRLVAAIWVAVWILGYFTSTALIGVVRQPWCPLVSYTNNLSRLREEALGTAAARDRFMEAVIQTRQAALDAAIAAGPLGPFTRIGGMGRRPRRVRLSELTAEQREEYLERMPYPLQLHADRIPWTWPAGVLCGLLVLSVGTLATRVQSLDRLK